MTRDEVFEKVREAFVEALGVDDDEVEPEARIFDDLGAESLDLLEIVFLLERAFDIKIPRGGVEKAARDGIIDGEPYEIDGVLTARGLDALRQAMPEVPPEEFREGLKTAEVPTLFRVATFYRLVLHLMAEAEVRAAG